MKHSVINRPGRKGVYVVKRRLGPPVERNARRLQKKAARRDEQRFVEEGIIREALEKAANEHRAKANGGDPSSPVQPPLPINDKPVTIGFEMNAKGQCKPVKGYAEKREEYVRAAWDRAYETHPTATGAIEAAEEAAAKAGAEWDSGRVK